MAKRYSPDDMAKIIQEMEGASARAAILVSVSVLEYALEELLEGHMRAPASASERNEMFGYTGVVGNLAAKTWLAYFLRLIGPTTRKELDIVRAIRNECAHNMNPLSFDDPAIAGRCRSLNEQRSPRIVEESDPRRVYLGTVAVLAAVILARSIYLKTGDGTRAGSGPLAEAFIQS